MVLPEHQRRQVFQILGGGLFLCGVVAIIVLDYAMIHSFVMPIGWALCCSLALRPVNRAVRAILAFLAGRSLRSKIALLLLVWGTYLYAVGWMVYKFWVDFDISARALFIFLASLLAGLLLLPHFLNTETLAATILLSSICIVGLFTVGVFSKMCYDESMIASDLFQKLVNDNAETLTKLQDTQAMVELWHDTEALCQRVSSATLYLPGSLSNMVLAGKPPEVWCTEQVENFKANLGQYYEQAVGFASTAVVWLGRSAAAFFASATSSLTSIPMSLFVFWSFLFYFVKFEEAINKEITALSPLSGNETDLVVQSLYDKVVKTILIHVLESMFSFVTTVCAFIVGGFPIKWVFAFAAAFLELLPFGTPWFVWLPSLAWTIARDTFLSRTWVIMITIFAVSQFIIAPFITSIVKLDKQNPVIINVSLLLGYYAFGSYGVLLGPVLAGVSLVLLDLYKQYSNTSNSRRNLFAGINANNDSNEDTTDDTDTPKAKHEDSKQPQQQSSTKGAHHEQHQSIPIPPATRNEGTARDKPGGSGAKRTDGPSSSSTTVRRKQHPSFGMDNDPKAF